ncbi:putative disease resistance protein RGA1 [Bienertia sinuspersici]
MSNRLLDKLPNLISIRIEGCQKCKVVPSLSQLPHLKCIQLSHLDDLEYVEDEDNMWAHNVYFPSLELLWLTTLPQLKGWTRALKDDGRRKLLFPHVMKMSVFECPQFMSMHLAPKLESLDAVAVKPELLGVESNVTSLDDERAARWSSLPTPFTSLKQLRLESAELTWKWKKRNKMKRGAPTGVGNGKA